MRYRRKPLTVEAVQWTGTNLAEVISLMGNGDITVAKMPTTPPALMVASPDRQVSCSLWGWVVRYPSGFFTTMRAEEFAETFEGA